MKFIRLLVWLKNGAVKMLNSGYQLNWTWSSSCKICFPMTSISPANALLLGDKRYATRRITRGIDFVTFFFSFYLLFRQVSLVPARGQKQNRQSQRCEGSSPGGPGGHFRRVGHGPGVEQLDRQRRATFGFRGQQGAAEGPAERAVHHAVRLVAFSSII